MVVFKLFVVYVAQVTRSTTVWWLSSLLSCLILT
ncbi:Uncharacterised protein [Vibrio cholerae]|nr:Uncharacterised protein [Vibrio cholerae]